MTPIDFPQANVIFGPPNSLEESQCGKVAAYRSEISGGSCDGMEVVVVAWQPNELDLARLNKGEPIYLSSIGGLPPHFLTTNFADAIRPA